MPLEQRRKTSDLSVTLSGDCWIKRLLKNGPAMCNQIETCVSNLVIAGVFQDPAPDFCRVCDLFQKVPLLGATLSVNAARALSCCREALGLAPLAAVNAVAWKRSLRMHANVRRAADLLSISSVEDATKFAAIISTVIDRHCPRHASSSHFQINVLDVVLVCCEYSACLKELPGCFPELKSATNECRAMFLSARLPSTQAEVIVLHRALSNRIERCADVWTGVDGANARHNVRYWAHKYFQGHTNGCLMPWLTTEIAQCM